MLNANGFWLAGLVLLFGALASGGYVAFTLTSFQPIQTLKGTYQAGKGGWLRKTLVVAQFSASVALVIATMVLYRQLQFMQNKDLGVRLAQRVVIKGPQSIKWVVHRRNSRPRAGTQPTALREKLLPDRNRTG